MNSSGRTTRMLEAAISAAHGKADAYGVHVLIVAFNKHHRHSLWSAIRLFDVFMPIERDYRLYPTSCGAGMIELKMVEELCIDWTTLTVKNIPASTLVLFDHFTIEASLALAIKEINRFDLGMQNV